MQKAKNMFGLDFFKGGIGGDINNAACGVQLYDGVFTDIDALPEFLVGNNVINFGVDRNPEFELLLTTLELRRLLLHLPADSTAFQIRLALFRALYRRDTQDVAIVEFSFECQPFIAEILRGAILRIFCLMRYLCFEHRAR